MNNFDIEKLRLSVELQTNFSLPIYTPRTSFNLIRENDEYLLNDLTLNFDPFTIKILKAEFENRNNELTKYEFLKILRDQMPNWQPNLPNRYNKLVRCLNILFGEIDINGNGTLEWEEFTNYIIDKANVINTMKQKNDILDQYVKNDKQFYTSSHIELVKCIEIPIVGQLAFFEQNSNEIKFGNLKDFSIQDDTLVVNDDIKASTKESQKHLPMKMVKNSILIDIIAFVHNKEIYLLTSSNNGIIRSYRYKNKFELDNTLIDYQIVYDSAQLVIVWDPISEVLYSGEMNGIINMYDQRSEPQLKRFANSEYKNPLAYKSKIRRTDSENDEEAPLGHSDSITVLLPIVKLQFLASASMDRKIILWDVIKNKKKKEFKNFHKKAITCLDYSEQLIILLSGSLDHQIYIWNPYVDSPIYSLKDHSFPVLSLKLVDEPFHLLSLDNVGNIKLWDVRKLKCLNTFNVKDKAQSPSSMLIIQKRLRLVTVSKKLTLYNYSTSGLKTDDEDNVGHNCYFVEDGLIFATVKNNSVKLFNALTGDIKKIFNNLSTRDITAFIIDKFEKRFIFGDVAGVCKVYNLFNGAYIKSLKGHESEIKFIFHSQKLERILTASLDNTILVHDDSELNEDKILRKIDLNNFHIVHAELESSDDFLICLTSQNQIMKLDALSGKKSFFYSEFFKEDGEYFCLLNDLFSVIILCNNNMINLFCFSPLVLKTDILLSIDILKAMEENCKSGFTADFRSSGATMNMVKYVQIGSQNYLITSDNRGYLHKFEVTELIAEINNTIKLITFKKWIKDPKVNNSMIKYLWSVKINMGSIRTISFNVEERIVITTCIENKVVISSLDDGQCIEVLRNNLREIKLKPIAYKKLGKNEIVCSEDKERVDNVYINFMKIIDELRLKQKRIHDREVYIQLEQQVKKVTQAFEKEEINVKPDDHDEFDPKFFIREKLDPKRIKNFSSNSWALRLNIDKYHKQFEERIYNSKFDPKVFPKTNNRLMGSTDMIGSDNQSRLSTGRRFTLERHMIDNSDHILEKLHEKFAENKENFKITKLPAIKVGKKVEINQKSRYKEAQTNLVIKNLTKFRHSTFLDSKTKAIMKNLANVLEDTYK